MLRTGNLNGKCADLNALYVAMARSVGLRPGWRVLDAGVSVAIATNCNPGSSYTSSMPFCVALAVREMGMTPAEAVWAR